MCRLWRKEVIIEIYTVIYTQNIKVDGLSNYVLHYESFITNYALFRMEYDLNKFHTPFVSRNRIFTKMVIIHWGIDNNRVRHFHTEICQ